MGVHGLWELLAPVGRRVSVETLAGKKLAIDASIWMIQFMKAMRDDKGEMVRNAHILGFFRRICKLLFLRTKPVFVFDGATPALKRRTVIARRRQRENAQTKIRKTAEKLLLNHLKSMRLKELAMDLENQRRNKDAKGKKVITDHPEDSNLRGDDNTSTRYNQEALDEMLAASIAAEEDGSLTGNASTSGTEIPIEEEEDGDDDEEMILPTMHEKVDPAVLATLPPSMQLDLLVQMRERLMAENRQKYQKVKQAPSKFSELQIQSYLKTVAFRREIDEVQRSAAGRGVGGVQTSRIASEANREFIFSSSFTGDRQVLTSARVKGSFDGQHQTPADHPSSDLPESVASTNRPNAATGPGVAEPREFHDDLETYLDERGRVRVSRVRAMGIRMTRDLQRNLDLMKEIELEKTSANKIATEDLVPNKNMNGVPRKSPSKRQLPETSVVNNVPFNLNVRNEESISESGTSIVVCLEDDGEHKYSDGDDELFARLVAGDTVVVSSADTHSKKHHSDSASDCDWEEGVIEEKSDRLTHNDKVENKSSPAGGGVDDESDVEWEEVSFDVPNNHASPRSAEYLEIASKGVLEEEADLQEAIRRSLGDTRDLKSLDVSSEVGNSNEPIEMAHDDKCISPLYQENDRVEAGMLLRNIQQTIGPSCEIVAGVEKLNNLGDINLSNHSSGRQSAPSISVHSDEVDFIVDKPSESGDSHGDIGHMNQIAVHKEEGVHLVVEQHLDTSIGGVLTTTCSGVGPHVSGLVLGDVSDVMLADVHENDSEMVANDHSNETKKHVESFVKESRTNIDYVEKWSEEKNHGDFLKERDDNEVDKLAFKDNREQVEVTKASLEEEILVLGKEQIDLGEEQRKLERNLESASSEMFAECQELLQMFGLPYIIAPMEAEAQCAYMELANLVDGVVTDDSDAFLFGARSVYKNIFDERKYVETYLMKDIENELGITREQLIRMALLLGSDYTEGVSGIGIVNAVEVVNAFPEEDGLRKFREWIESPDPSILGQFDVQTGSSSRKRGSKVGNNDTSCLDSNVEGLATANQNVLPSVELIENLKQIFMDKHRNVSKNWHIPSTFPSEVVISAYASPQVDKSTDPFSWGKPDLFVLRKLCWEKFGWGSQKADELLLPVLKEYNKHETQLRLEAFYTFNERFAKIRSKRIKKAVKGITGKKSLELMDDSVQEGSESRKKRRVSPSQPGDGKPGNPVCGTENGITGDESNSVEKSTAKRSRNTTNKGSSARRRGRGRGRSQSVGRGKWKENDGCGFDETSSSDENGSDSEQDVEVQKKGALQETRRSTRLRKSVKYTENDLEVTEPAKSDKDDKKWIDEAAVEEEPFSDGDLPGDAAVGPRAKNIHKVGDTSLGGLREEYLAVGGGFCTDEDEHETETCQLGSNHGGDPSFMAESNEDDLKMGGGFCLDEDETDEDPRKWTSTEARATISENTELSHCSGFIEEVNNDTGRSQLVSRSTKASDGLQNGGSSDAFDTEQNLGRSNATISNDNLNLAMPPQIVKEDNTGTTSERSLSAMPYLRRKRRKT